MKNNILHFIIATVFLSQSLSAYTVTSQSQNGITNTKKHDLGNALCATVLFVGGAWLAHKQLPRLAGQQIELNAPLFTKAFASILFALGIAGGTTGAYSLVTQIRDKLN